MTGQPISIRALRDEIEGAVEMARHWLRHPEAMTDAGFPQVCRELYTISRALVRLRARFTDWPDEPKDSG